MIIIEGKNTPRKDDLQSLRSRFGRLWHFIWEEDSVASWAVNIVLAFVIIKFIVYPGLGFLLGTSYPIVAVVSGSMEHDGSFDEWWAGQCGEYSQEEWYAQEGISKDIFGSFSFRNGFNKGDVMILSSPSAVNRGDVIVFSGGGPDPIIHRVVRADANSFKTKGDHNCDSSEFEEQVMPEAVFGKAVVRLPYLGWVKLGFLGMLRAVGITK